MPRYLIPVTVKIEVEADTHYAAIEKVYRWRTFIMGALRGRLEELGIKRCSVPPVREVIEADDPWFDNERFRPRVRRSWVYDVQQVPIHPGSQTMLTLRVAKEPVEAGTSAESVAQHPLQATSSAGG